jgi:hypothetical protein
MINMAQSYIFWWLCDVILNLSLILSVLSEELILYGSKQGGCNGVDLPIYRSYICKSRRSGRKELFISCFVFHCVVCIYVRSREIQFLNVSEWHGLIICVHLNFQNYLYLTPYRPIIKTFLSNDHVMTRICNMLFPIEQLPHGLISDRAILRTQWLISWTLSIVFLKIRNNV